MKKLEENMPKSSNSSRKKKKYALRLKIKGSLRSKRTRST